MKQLYVIDYENARWCGGQLNCVVWADSEDEAILRAEEHMDQEQRELFSGDMDDEEDEEADNDVQYTVNSVELLKGSTCEEYYADEKQRAYFYPCVNEEDAPE